MRWPPYQHIFFDCDSTLTTVEGIDILAESAGKKWRVEVLTNAAMNGALDLEDVYAKRLQAVRPTRGQVRAIRSSYKKNVVEDAPELIAALQALGHQIYIISGGLYEPVKEFGIALGVPEQHIRAVGVQYNQLAGDWWKHGRKETEDRYTHFEEGALTISDGKAEIVRELLAQNHATPNERTLLIGDGSSDLLASRSVELFVGFGGVITRQRVLREAPAFIHSPSLAPLLALILGPAGLTRLENTPHAILREKCLALIEKGELTFTDEQLKQKFHNAYQTIFARPHRS